VPFESKKQIGDATPHHAAKLPKDWIVPKNVSIENVIGDISKGVSTRK